MLGEILGAVGGSIASGLLGQSGARDQMRFNAREAELNRQFQERMSSTAHQRQVADMRKAGLNPILSVTGGKGASTPSGGQASSSLNPLSEAAHSARQVALMTSQIQNIKADTELKSKQAKSQSAGAEVSDIIADFIKAIRGELGMGGTPANSAKNLKEFANSIITPLKKDPVLPKTKFNNKSRKQRLLESEKRWKQMGKRSKLKQLFGN